MTCKRCEHHDRFGGIPDFPYAPRYAEVSDDKGGVLRVAWVEDGPPGADPILMLHGEPSSSYLYRKMIPVLAPPVTESFAFDVLDLRNVTLAGHIVQFPRR